MEQYQLPADIKKAWLEALRSGSYVQTRGQYKKTLHPDGRAEFCAMGVLYEIQRRDLTVNIAFDDIDKHVHDAITQWNDTDQLSFIEIAQRIEEQF